MSEEALSLSDGSAAYCLIESFSFCFVSFFSLDLQKGKVGGSTCLHCSFQWFRP
ncbi:unnamed protein product [Brassica rapa]|uniref:Uncharacterized protein n=1 Tax=Brassica campestris TaxID=3711 RepID=A0A8D9LU11_BRACM|nr:unnamed protein product [Brassica rapa]